MNIADDTRTTRHRPAGWRLGLVLAAIAAACPACAQAADQHGANNTNSADARVAAAAVQAQASAPDDIAPDALQTITVNARRRDEDPQKVPVPMTVLNGATLENQRVYQLQDLQQLLPSTSISLAQPRQASISVRGIGANSGNSDGIDSSVGIYLDNVYLGRASMAVTDLLDIDQVELLRGPQGTLFGKNTTAGVLNIHTRQPSFERDNSVEASTGSNGYYQTKAILSGPISDTWAGRLTVSQTHQGGNVDNLANGEKLNGGTRRGIRGQLLYQPDDRFSLRLIGDYSEENSSNGVSVFYNAGPTINGVNKYLASSAQLGNRPVTDPSLYQVNFDADQHVSVRQGGASAEANWKLDSGFKLTSITAWRFWDFKPDNGAFTPVLSNYGVQVEDSQFSQEIRLASPIGGAFDYVAGAYYFNQRLSNRTFFNYGPKADLGIVGANFGVLNNVTLISPGQVDTDSYALFGQGTWHVTQRLDVTAGVRGTYEEKRGWVRRDTPHNANPATAPFWNAFGLTPYDSGNLKIGNFSPSALLNLAYKIDDNVLGYATLSHGEKSGGLSIVGVSNAPTLGSGSLLIGPERANAAELGIKSALFDQRLHINANLFWTGINNYQATAFLPSPSGINLPTLVNVGKVRSRGAELDIQAQPLKGLTLGFNTSFTDATYLSYDKAPCPAEIANAAGAPSSCSLSGARVADVPRWSASLSAQYRHHVSDNVDHYVAGSYAWRSSARGAADNSVYSEIPAYGLLNLATGLRLYQGDSKSWELSLWARNVLDKRYYLSVYSAGAGTQASGLYYNAAAGQSRTVGATLRYNF
ncbi:MULTISPECIES: TonB-dependent receptor [unclassified Herbaspirillum]|uniref:TonB-dependent receptor n=1 Tax=unclassified Herbaspirillum TaxID=2624150 RepID=UPI001152566C|nr:MULTISPECIES: TonB-dependent receptor [unclassified Herbaspirillum]MBB5391018.1 iron complex outermembrane receptor protein [Herbaspirillum sp. SJZ102]TQK13282.1 iron complex outermembrane receptor protein [Herbaspirillum sp. SJZ130]TQK15286.1 iron complex outermembrane receptor protein [Herbaspirillum sp. SJZ106]TWC62595.1 iron complex outermembrane receptor protein [Herbaspirillum sp. SJZ099]